MISKICNHPVLSQIVQSIIKTLGIEWNYIEDYLRLTVAEMPSITHATKGFLISDVAKTFDILGWFSPCTVFSAIVGVEN